MKITIDTKEDSHEDIRKVVELLSTIMKTDPTIQSANIFDQPSPSVGNVMGIFDVPATAAPVVHKPQVQLY